MARQPERAALQAAVVPHRFHRQPGRSQFPQSDHRARADRGPAPGRGVRASALGRVLPRSRLRDVVGADRAQHPVPPEFPGTESEQRVDLGHRPVRAGNPAARADQGPLRRAHPVPRLQQPAGRARGQRRLRAQRDPAAFPQCAQWRRERRRRQRAPLPRHVLRLPLEHDARPARQDQHPGHRSACLRARRQRRPRPGGGRLPRNPGHHVGP